LPPGPKARAVLVKNSAPAYSATTRPRTLPHIVVLRRMAPVDRDVESASPPESMWLWVRKK